MKTETINWSRIELETPITYKDEGLYFTTKILKRNKGVVMCEIAYRGQKMMKQLDTLPVDAQTKIKDQIVGVYSY